MSESEAKPRTHRGVQIDERVGTDQRLKYDTDEIFGSEGWTALSAEEAEAAAKENPAKIYGVYDPLETVYSRGNQSTSTRIVVKFSPLRMPREFTHFKSIQYYKEEEPKNQK